MLIWKGLDDFDSSEANNPPKIMAGQPTPSPNPNVPPPPPENQASLLRASENPLVSLNKAGYENPYFVRAFSYQNTCIFHWYPATVGDISTAKEIT